MKKNISNKIAALFAITVLLTGCASRKTTVISASKLIDTLKLNVLAKIQAQQIHFSTLNIKGKSSINLSNNNFDANINLRIQKDKLIWASVSAFGIEAARTLIKPDSVFILNKIQNEYIANDFTYLSKLIDAPVDFYLLQNLLIGNVPPILLDSNTVLNNDSTHIQLTNTLHQIVTYQAQFDTNCKIQSLTINDKLNNKNLYIHYIYKDSDLPYRIEFTFEYQQQKSTVKIDYTKIITDKEIEVPFKIPKRLR